VIRIVYLHGFASTPLSNKAQFFKRHFAQLDNVEFDIPQLDQGNFNTLTITGQLRVIDQAVHGDRVILMGSSLGGYLAARYASRHANVERLVLLAPAFEFPSRWRQRFANDLARWQSSGSLPFYHYGFKEERPLHYQFVEDAVQYEDVPDFKQPALIFHGTQDAVVPPEVSERFAATHSNVKLELVESGHELTDVLDRLWAETAKFLGFQKP
jgi:pimeloyl-ACP methyl ester carboxylesterase